MALTLTPVVTYAPGANENPVNPALWTTPSGYNGLRWVATGTGSPYLRATTTAGPCAGIYTGSSFNNDQYAVVTLKAFASGNGQDWSMYVRSDSTLQNAYQMNFLDNGAGSLLPTLYKIKDGIQTVLFENQISYTAGDTFTLAVVGHIVYAYQNSTLLVKFEDQQLPITTGNPGSGIDALTSASNDVRLNVITFGNASGVDNTGTHTLSGSTGIAGTTVTIAGAVSGTLPIAIADGSGNYSITGLPNDTYTVYAFSNGYTFTPVPGTVTISGADGTQNFTGTATSIALTPQFTDTFQYADVSPLPVPWAAPGGSYTAVQVVSNLAEGTAVGASGAYYNGTPLPNDQYASFKLATFNTSVLPAFSVEARAAADFSTSYDIYVTPAANGYVNISLESTPALFAILSYIPYSIGDVFTLAAIGTKLYCLKNGIVIMYASTALYASGHAGFVMTEEIANNDTQSSSFVVGAAALGGGAVGWSPVDSRNFATFPNTGIVQSDGSVFYIGQTSSNSLLPPTDSRAAGAPVDSRVDKPVNSRVDPSA
jgi:hypothetical protein